MFLGKDNLWLEYVCVCVYRSGGSIICPEGGSLECIPAPMLTLTSLLTLLTVLIVTSQLIILSARELTFNTK